MGTGYLLFLPFHGSLAEALVNMAIAGTGSGALVAALPSAASVLVLVPRLAFSDPAPVPVPLPAGSQQGAG